MEPAPFGVRTKRFNDMGLHPKSNRIGFLKKYPHMGPFTYIPNFQYLRKHIRCTNWKREVEMKVFSETLGRKVKGILEQREWDRAGGGPAIQNLFDFLEVANMKHGSVYHNVGFSTAKRFKVREATNVPGPGTYGMLPLRNRAAIQYTFLPPFEWDGFIPRFTHGKKGLAANRYILKDPNTIQEFVKRYVSKRGPYDCFTGPRDERTIKNHFGPPSFKGTQNWLHSLPTEVDRFKRPEYANYGKWVKGNRFETIPTSRIMVSSITLCRKDPDSPSPASYKARIPDFKVESVKDVPFYSTVAEARPSTGFKIQPGVARYGQKVKKPYVNGHTNVFKSRTPQTMSWVKPAMNAF